MLAFFQFRGYTVITQSKARGEAEKQKEYIYYYGARTNQKCGEKFQNGRGEPFQRNKSDFGGFFRMRSDGKG